MTQFWVEPLTDLVGDKYWVLFTHGNFHEPTAVIADVNMQAIVDRVRPRADIAVTELGKAIHAYRRRRKISQAELAERVGISRNYLSQIERGQAGNISMEYYNAIREAIK